MPTCTVNQTDALFERRNNSKKWTAQPHRPKRFYSTKVFSLLCSTIAATFGFLFLAGPAELQAQTVRAQLQVISLAPARLRIDLDFPSPTNALSFRNSYGDAVGLAERIERLEAYDATGDSVEIRKMAPGNFTTVERVGKFRYYVNVAEPGRPEQMARVSWLNSEHGLLMLADLLPRFAKDATSISAVEVQIVTPGGWIVTSNIARSGAEQFSTSDPDRAVFLLGATLKETSQRFGSATFSLITSGKWPFPSAEVVKISQELIGEYSRVTGFDLEKTTTVMLLPFPDQAGAHRWSAETRGNNVVLLLGNKASRKRVLSRLSIVLSHELFHLWVPNSLTLEGDYDWFFEGFTLYQALRTDLRLGLISFEEFLRTIGRVYESYLASGEFGKLSLTEASERRWTTPSAVVYDKGMLVAFIYDLFLRNLTACEADLDEVYQRLFRLSSTGQRGGNDTIIKLLGAREGMEFFPRDYVEANGSIDLRSALTPYGMELQRQGSGTKLLVSLKLNPSQRKLLECLGYRK